MVRRQQNEEELRRELEHAFEASLTGGEVSEEQINAMLDSAQKTAGVWNSAPAQVGSFAAIVNSHGHFPQLSSSPPASSASAPCAAPSSLPPADGHKGWAVMAASAPAAGPLLASAAERAPEGQSAKGKQKKKGVLLNTSSRRNYK